MKWHHLFAMAILAQPLIVAGAQAQQAAGAAAGQQGAGAAGQQAGQGQGGGRGQFGPGTPVGDEYSYPAGVAIAKAKIGPVFVDHDGKTLYQPNVRYLQIFAQGALGGQPGASPFKFCTNACAENWTPVAASADAKPTGYWKVVEGAQGPQWAYKNSPVFTYNADKTAGALGGDGVEDMWKAVAYIPPVPKIAAPGNVAPLFTEGDYALADKQGHVLYAKNATCADACAHWTPFLAGMASQPVGEWSVLHDGDRPQWAFRGKPVYVSDAQQASNLPNEASVLRP